MVNVAVILLVKNIGFRYYIISYSECASQALQKTSVFIMRVNMVPIWSPWDDLFAVEDPLNVSAT